MGTGPRPRRPDTRRTPPVHGTDTSACCHDVMTNSRLLPMPDDVTVVEVYGSRFVLEWLSRDRLAGVAAAARHDDPAAAEVPPSGASRDDTPPALSPRRALSRP